jgi:hypothetical protein
MHPKGVIWTVKASRLTPDHARVTVLIRLHWAEREAIPVRSLKRDALPAYPGWCP